MRSFLLMLTFLTRLPIPISFEFEEEDFAKGLWFLPVIGFIIGCPLWLLYKYGTFDNEWLLPLFGIILYLAITGGLHLDGLADFFDGIFSSRAREKILEIMKDVHVGTFGVIGLILYFMAMAIGMKDAGAMTMLLMPIAGRVMGHFVSCIGHYPKEKGMGMPMINYGQLWHSIVILAVFMVVVYVAGSQYVIVGVVVILFALLVTYRTTKIIGGVTGDVIGAVIEMSQVIWLLTCLVMGV